MNFLDLSPKAKRAAFAKMDAAEKAKKAASARTATPKRRKAASSRGARPTIDPSRQVSLDSHRSGRYTDAEVETLIRNYRTMHGKDPSPAQLAKLRRKRR